MSENNIIGGFSASKLKREIKKFKEQNPPLSPTSQFANQSMTAIYGALERYQKLIQSGKIPNDLETTNPALEERLRNGGVSEFIANGIATFEQIEKLEEHQIDNCLRRHVLSKPIMEGLISIEQISKLNMQQTNALVRDGETGDPAKLIQRLADENNRSESRPVIEPF